MINNIIFSRDIYFASKKYSTFVSLFILTFNCVYSQINFSVSPAFAQSQSQDLCSDNNVKAVSLPQMDYDSTGCFIVKEKIIQIPAQPVCTFISTPKWGIVKSCRPVYVFSERLITKRCRVSMAYCTNNAGDDVLKWK